MKRKDALAAFMDLRLTPDVLLGKNDGGPITGATARVETSGDIERRITATRLVLSGPFALAFRKKKDHRKMYLTVEGQGWAVLREFYPFQETAARRFAQQVNVAGRQPVR